MSSESSDFSSEDLSNCLEELENEDLEVVSTLDRLFEICGVQREKSDKIKVGGVTYKINSKLLDPPKSEQDLTSPKLEGSQSVNVVRIQSSNNMKLNQYFKNGKGSSENQLVRQETMLEMVPTKSGYMFTKDDLQRALRVLRDESTNKKHMIFYYASPLKPPSASKSKSELPLIDFMSEYRGIQKALKNTGKDIKYLRKVATPANIAEMIKENPTVLHFSGHGAEVHQDLKCNPDINSSYTGDYLVIEDDYCGGIELNQNKLKNLLDQADITIEVAVVLSCHSEYIGQMFLKAGIKHVICVGREFKIDDKACIAFAGAFYSIIFNENKTTICQAFKTAKATVKTQFGKDGYQGEEAKFRCLHHHKKKPCDSHCIAVRKGRAEDFTTKPSLKLLPQREKLVGRADEICEILKKLDEERFIWLEGETGIGKSAIAKEICWLCYNRSIFEDGVMYISARSFKDFYSMVENIFFSIKEGLVREDDRAKLEAYITADYAEKYRRSISLISGLKILIILDNCDYVVETQEKLMKEFVKNIAIKVEEARIIFTSKSAASSYTGDGGASFRIKNLTNQQTYQLLCSKVKSVKECKEQILELQKDLTGSQKASVKSDPKKIDFNNEFLNILNGHPHSVILVSSLNSDLSLKNIYKRLMSIKKRRSNFGGIDNLIFSLNIESTLTYLKKQNPEAYRVLLLFALCPDGFTNDSMIEICINWSHVQRVLIDKALINAATTKRLNNQVSSITAATKLDSMVERPVGKKMFQMEASLICTILKRMTSEELQTANHTVVTHLVDELDRMLKNYKLNPKDRYNGLRSFDSNIQEAINRYYGQKMENERKKIELENDVLHVKKNQVRFKFLQYIIDRGLIKLKDKSPKICMNPRSKSSSLLIKKKSYGRQSSVIKECFNDLNNFPCEERINSSSKNMLKIGSKPKNKEIMKTFVDKFVKEVDEEAKKIMPLHVAILINKFKNIMFKRINKKTKREEEMEKKNFQEEIKEEAEEDSDGDKTPNKEVKVRFEETKKDTDSESEQSFIPESDSSEEFNGGTLKRAALKNSSKNVKTYPNIQVDGDWTNQGGTQEERMSSNPDSLAPKMPFGFQRESKLPSESSFIDSVSDSSRSNNPPPTPRNKLLKSRSRTKRMHEIDLLASDELLNTNKKGTFEVPLNEKLIILFSVNQLMSEQYDSFDTIIDDAVRFLHENLTLGNLYKLICLKILLKEDAEQGFYKNKDKINLDVDISKYLYEAQSNLDKTLAMYKQTKCIQGCARVHLLQCIISSRLIKIEESEGIFDHEFSNHYDSLKEAFSNFKFRMEQVVSFDSRSISKQVFEFVKKNEDKMQEVNILQNEEVLRFLYSPCLSTKAEGHIDFEDKRLKYMKSLRLTLKNHVSHDVKNMRRISLDVDLNDNQLDLLYSAVSKEETLDDKESVEERKEENKKSKLEVKKEKKNFMNLLVKSIANKFLPTTPTSPSKSPKFGNQKESDSEENKNEVSSQEEIMKQKKRELKLESLPSLEINIPQDCVEVEPRIHSRNQESINIQSSSSISKISSSAEFKSGIKCVNSINAAFAYPDRYTLRSCSKYSNPGSFDYNSYKNDAKKSYTAMLNRNHLRQTDYVPVKYSQFANTRGYTSRNFNFSDDLQSEYRERSSSQKSRSDSCNRSKPLRRTRLRNSRERTNGYFGYPYRRVL
ncbi:unnamed protein product [Moneuplotes crassus]|uniref:CHAT domain-containing protein n=1 Tax=Euplotes crassus TaxID=5936 RepID=A0AAD2D890_EUPCR|nr:unnamed protein product [Moneuplotes crassus]